MVAVIMVALSGSLVTPEYVNFTSQVIIDLANHIPPILQLNDIATTILNEQKHTCLKANAIETAPLMSPAHQITTWIKASSEACDLNRLNPQFLLAHNTISKANLVLERD